MSGLTTEALILEEVRAVRASVDELRSESLQRIQALETQTKPLFDNGQPGLLTQIVNRITALEDWRMKTLGAAGAVAAIIGFAFKLWK